MIWIGNSFTEYLTDRWFLLLVCSYQLPQSNYKYPLNLLRPITAISDWKDYRRKRITSQQKQKQKQKKRRILLWQMSVGVKILKTHFDINHFYNIDTAGLFSLVIA
jgi:hypothetical protein